MRLQHLRYTTHTQWRNQKFKLEGAQNFWTPSPRSSPSPALALLPLCWTLPFLTAKNVASIPSLTFKKGLRGKKFSPEIFLNVYIAVGGF